MRSRALGVAMILLAAGCGSRRETLATVGDRRITRQDFIAAFSNMSPSEQVDVLELQSCGVMLRGRSQQPILTPFQSIVAIGENGVGVGGL